VEQDLRIDAFIAKAAPFAQPILIRFRTLVHATVPNAVETIKWGMPHFTLNGKILAGMAAFKAHAALILHGAGKRQDGEGMGHYGKLTSIEDMPPDAELRGLLLNAAERIRTGAKVKTATKAELPIPADLALALSASGRATLEGFAPSHRREYLVWIAGAKRSETRIRRIAQAAQMLSEGRKRYDK